MRTFTIKGNTYETPLFLPDATLGVVRTLDSSDLAQVGTKGIVVNTYHLIKKPNLHIIQSFGGIKNFMNFKGLVVSDSGGWQIFSLIHRHKGSGKITEDGVQFSDGTLLTPEDVIEYQNIIGSDIHICLDDFTDPSSGYADALKSVENTINWAKRSKRKFLEMYGDVPEGKRPYLLAPIQGGIFKDLREMCAKELINIGFDGYGFGGYLVDETTGKLDTAFLKFLADLIPKEALRFALGTGKPQDIVSLYKAGWDIFDCTLPTRDARHKRAYIYKKDSKNPFTYIYINKKRYSTDDTPLDEECNCPTCQTYSKGYIHHLFNIKETTGLRLMTLHNLSVFNKVCADLRDNIL